MTSACGIERFSTMLADGSAWLRDCCEDSAQGQEDERPHIFDATDRIDGVDDAGRLDLCAGDRPPRRRDHDVATGPETQRMKLAPDREHRHTGVHVEVTRPRWDRPGLNEAARGCVTYL